MTHPERSHGFDPGLRLEALRRPWPELVQLDETSMDEKVDMLDGIDRELSTASGRERETLLTWTAFASRFTSPQEIDAGIRLSEEFGYSPNFFRRAREWTHLHGEGTERLAPALAMNGLLEAVHGGILDGLDLQTQLQEAMRPNVQLSQKQLDRFDLVPLRVDDRSTAAIGSEHTWCENIRDNVFYYMHLDAPVGFALTYRGWPQAFVSLSTQSPDEMIIHQVQGARGFYVDPDDPKKKIGDKPSTLSAFDWPQLMYGLSEELASELGISIIRVVGSEGQKSNINNKTFWPAGVPPVEGGVRFTEARAQKIYDQIPPDIGFSPDDHKNWYKPVDAELSAGDFMEAIRRFLGRR